MNSRPSPGLPLSVLLSRLRRLHRPTVALLTVVALVRPVFSVTGATDALGRPLTPLLLTLLISLFWILAVGLSRVREPLLTPVAAGVAYAVAALVLGGVLSPVLTGELRGPLARPQAILPMLLVNGVWGAVCALGVRRLRGGAA
ncbi:hypothetical protein J2S54_003629 [Streptomyces sp. DSM 42143]|uniref:hypothetical protein n=1 Tax=Streptomyces sp. DSM 42143 TaxID=2817711 RepID=UPI00277F33DE|nr:hypothetical protein [Streptomyces sp. DSM 42143]MDQ0386809.1 hypothetical protein [Streptomyces sp. DSM 42143]